MAFSWDVRQLWFRRNGCHRADKPIALAIQRFDQRRLILIGLHGASNLRQAAGQRRFTDKRFWPAVRQKLFFGDNPLTVFK